ncbi:MAG TPA: patatin-like phospholipase family protein [Terriglobales bacterium]|nr:patatin-like phospholipase family protein [Terriglobales bacterium]
MKSVLRLSLSFLLFFSFLATYAEGPAEPHSSTVIKKAPRVALVLDAGGALGLAHIGVIQWMEEHRIPVHYVAGTSMGGLIGGAYATGMSPSELKKLVGSIDWANTVFNGEPQYRDLTFRLKQDQREYPNEVEFGLNRGLRMPTGLNSGMNVDRVITSFALPYSAIANFDELPIPFRCVATDLNSGELHVFKDGAFGDALRASMSIPAVFEPVRIENSLYVDGTLLDPLPTDVARQMGSDVVIAVYLESYVNNREPQSPFGVLFRSLEAVTLNSELRGMAGADVVVKVPVPDFTNFQYSRWEELVARGYQEAQKNSAALLEYALSEEEWKEYIAQREARKKPMPLLRKVEFNGDAQLASIRGLAEMQGKALDALEVDRHLAQIGGEKRWSRIQPSLATDRDGSVVLNFRAFAKEQAWVKVKPLVVLDGLDYNNVRFSFGARVISPGVMASGAELRTDVMLGSTYRFRTEYILPVMSSKHWFTATSAGIENGPQDFYSSRGKTAEYRRIESTGGFDVGYTFGRSNEVRVGYQVGWLKYSSEMGNAIVPPMFKGVQRSTRFQYTLDRLDDPVVPTRGMGIDTAFAYYDRRAGTSESVPSLELKAQGHQPLSERGSLYVVGSAGTTFGFTDTGFPMFSLGSSTRLAAYGINEILTNQYWLVQAGYIHKLAAMPPMSGKNLYLTSGVELGKPFYMGTVSSLPMDVRIGIIAQTLIGPVSVGGAVGNTGHRKFFFQIGRVF